MVRDKILVRQKVRQIEGWEGGREGWEGEECIHREGVLKKGMGIYVAEWIQDLNTKMHASGPLMLIYNALKLAKVEKKATSSSLSGAI